MSHRDIIRRAKIGERVWVEGKPAEVIKHGRDAIGGPYTEVKFADGSRARYHRSWIKREAPDASP